MKKLILLFPIMIVLGIMNSGHVEAQHPADSSKWRCWVTTPYKLVLPISR